MLHCALYVAHAAVIGHSARLADTSAILLRDDLARTEMHVGRDSGQAVIGQFPGRLFDGRIPPDHVMDQKDATHRPRSQWSD